MVDLRGKFRYHLTMDGLMLLYLLQHPPSFWEGVSMFGVMVGFIVLLRMLSKI